MILLKEKKKKKELINLINFFLTNYKDLLGK